MFSQSKINEIALETKDNLHVIRSCEGFPFISPSITLALCVMNMALTISLQQIQSIIIHACFSHTTKIPAFI